MKLTAIVNFQVDRPFTVVLVWCCAETCRRFVRGGRLTDRTEVGNVRPGCYTVRLDLRRGQDGAASVHASMRGEHARQQHLGINRPD